MRSFNVLTPHYEEGVIYSLKAFDTARMLKLEEEGSALVRLLSDTTHARVLSRSPPYTAIL